MNREERKALEIAATQILNSQWGGQSKAQKRQENWRRSREKKKAKIAAMGPIAPRQSQPREDQGVYVIGAPGHPVKIGIAADVTKRLSTIQTGCPERLKVYLFLGVKPGTARAIEQECHRRLAAHRQTGEWFAMDRREAVSVVQAVAASVAWPFIPIPHVLAPL